MTFRTVVVVMATTFAVSLTIPSCGCTDIPLRNDHIWSSKNDSGSAKDFLDLAKITLQVTDRPAYDKLIATHRDKVVLVDFWATWCEPCVNQFPRTVELSKTSSRSKLAVISVSMDEPDDREKVLKFLQNAGAMFDNLISEYGVGQKGFEAFEIPEGVPHYKIYDHLGTLRHTTENSEEIHKLIEQLFTERS